MTVTVSPNLLTFSGVFDERTTMDDLKTAYKKLISIGMQPPVTVDFSNVPYANSSGLANWLRFLWDVKTPFKYINTPAWQVKHFNLTAGHFADGSYVESVQALFYSPSSRDSIAVQLELGKDIPILKNYAEFHMPNRKIDGKEYEMDFLPEKYFAFIADNFELFKNKLK